MMKTNKETQMIMLKIGSVQEDIAIQIGGREIKGIKSECIEIVAEYRAIENKLQKYLKDIEKEFKLLKEKYQTMWREQ